MLGYDENQKPRAAQFPATEAELVAKAAELMDLKVYQATSEDLAALAKKLPEGRLYGNGRGFVPNIRQSLYSEIIVTLAGEPKAAVSKDQDELPVATGLPRTWDEIAPGHLVIDKRRWNTVGGKQSSSVATATCSRCGFGTTRSCPSLRAIKTQSR